MNPEIELYRAVQEYREPWKFGDLLIHDEYGLAVVIGVSGRTIEVEFEGARGRRTLLADDKHITWLPPTAPRWPGDEGRNLWEIAANGHFLHVYWYPGGHTNIRGMGVKTIEADSLAEALLKLIAARAKVAEEPLNPTAKALKEIASEGGPIGKLSRREQLELDHCRNVEELSKLSDFVLGKPKE